MSVLLGGTFVPSQRWNILSPFDSLKKMKCKISRERGSVMIKYEILVNVPIVHVFRASKWGPKIYLNAPVSVPPFPRNNSLHASSTKWGGEGSLWDRNGTEMWNSWYRAGISSVGSALWHWDVLAKTGNSDFCQECREWPHTQQCQYRETGAEGSFQCWKFKINNQPIPTWPGECIWK